MNRGFLPRCVRGGSGARPLRNSPGQRPEKAARVGLPHPQPLLPQLPSPSLPPAWAQALAVPRGSQGTRAGEARGDRGHLHPPQRHCQVLTRRGRVRGGGEKWGAGGRRALCVRDPSLPVGPQGRAPRLSLESVPRRQGSFHGPPPSSTAVPPATLQGFSRGTSLRLILGLSAEASSKGSDLYLGILASYVFRLVLSCVLEEKFVVIWGLYSSLSVQFVEVTNSKTMFSLNI